MKLYLDEKIVGWRRNIIECDENKVIELLNKEPNDVPDLDKVGFQECEYIYESFETIIRKSDEEVTLELYNETGQLLWTNLKIKTDE